MMVFDQRKIIARPDEFLIAVDLEKFTQTEFRFISRQPQRFLNNPPEPIKNLSEKNPVSSLLFAQVLVGKT